MPARNWLLSHFHFCLLPITPAEIISRQPSPLRLVSRLANDHSSYEPVNSNYRCNAGLVAESSTRYYALVAYLCQEASIQIWRSITGLLKPGTNQTKPLTALGIPSPMNHATDQRTGINTAGMTCNTKLPDSYCCRTLKYPTTNRQQEGYSGQVYLRTGCTSHTKPLSSYPTSHSSPLPAAWAW